MPPVIASAPVFIETPASAMPSIGREIAIVDGRKFLIERPTETDPLLNDPVILQANVADDYMPYWADIWPAARMLAKAILREPWEKFKQRNEGAIEVLELGCGLGLGGLAALAKGFRVIFSDYDLTALRFAATNAKLNCFSDYRTLPLDWRFPPPGLQVALIIAADVIYEMRNIEPLVALLKQALLPGGLCLLTDPDRTPAPQLRETLTTEGFSYTAQFIRSGEPGGTRTKGTLYRITKPVQVGLS